MVAYVRGVQAAAFRAGWLLNAEPTQLILTADSAASAAVTCPETWLRLRAYREPYRAAVCALAAAELGVEDMLELRLCDVEPDGSAVAHAGARVELPAGSHPFMRAQLEVRHLEGAGLAEGLFVEAGGTPTRPRRLALALRSALVELGVAILSQQAVPARLDTTRWMKRWGISIQRLT